MTHAALPPDDIHPRRPLVAALLSLAMPGLGQLYNGGLNRALWLFLAFVAISVPGVAIAALYVPSVLMLPLLLASVLLTLGIWIGSVIDAWRGAARRSVYTRREWQVSGVYALLFLVGNAFILSLLVNTMRDHMVQAFSIPSASMEPGIVPGDYLFADKRYNCPGCKSRVAIGDVGVFVYPNDRTLYYIKRVIGLPGDRVTIQGHRVSINGRSLLHEDVAGGGRGVASEQFGAHVWQVQWSQVAAGPDIDVTVPPGQIFLLGDNRDFTTDSRQFGTVPLSDLVGKARQVWFSWGKDGIRWGRLGTVVE